MGIFITIAIVVFIFYMISRSSKNRAKLMEQLIAQAADRGINAEYKLVLPKDIVLIDTNAKTLGVLNLKAKNVTRLNWNEIRDYEITKDGITVYKKSGTLTNAAIGGVLFGGVGAIVGSNKTTTRGKEQIKKATLRIATRNFENPTINILIFDDTQPGMFAKKFLEETQKLCDRLAIIIEQSNAINVG